MWQSGYYAHKQSDQLRQKSDRNYSRWRTDKICGWSQGFHNRMGSKNAHTFIPFNEKLSLILYPDATGVVYSSTSLNCSQVYTQHSINI